MYDRLVREHALALLGDGASLSSVSRATGVSRSVLRGWRDDDITPRASASCPLVGDGPLTRADVASRSYAGLLGYYLGDGWLSEHRGRYTLRISCDAALPGIVEDVARVMAQVRTAGTVRRGRRPSVVEVTSTWKHWPCLFPQHGPGHKHERTLGMAAWQWRIVEEHPADFLRGLFHSDGCRVRNWATREVAGQRKRYDYPRWQFVNHSAEIRTWCGQALDLVCVPWRASSWKTISVSRREAVARLDELIGPKT